MLFAPRIISVPSERVQSKQALTVSSRQAERNQIKHDISYFDVVKFPRYSSRPKEQSIAS